MIQLWHWLAFGGMVLILLILDLTVFHRDDHAPTLKESAWWTVFWCSLALAFNGVIWWWLGHVRATEFLTGYVIEWSLSMDNVFVFAVIFRFFKIPLHFQYRVLFWGILGAILMRLTFVLVGAGLIKNFEWIMVLFGLFLVYTAVKLAIHTESEVHPDQNIVLRWSRKLFAVSRGNHHEHGHAFFVKENGKKCVTPLFLVLLVIESTDVMFAVDSVPAIFAVTKNPFIVFTSNIFAIMGLRALYFLLAGSIDLFRYLHYGLSAVLGFVGGNMILDYYLAKENEHLIPIPLKLGIIALLLGVSIVASIVAKKREERGGDAPTDW